ncbi:hypothetical protein AAMO2058_001332200 [Amorphochlora amoebiformis]
MAVGLVGVAVLSLFWLATRPISTVTHVKRPYLKLRSSWIPMRRTNRCWGGRMGASKNSPEGKRPSVEEINHYISREIPSMMMDVKGDVYIVNKEKNVIRRIDRRGKTTTFSYEEYYDKFIAEDKEAVESTGKKPKQEQDPKEKELTQLITSAKSSKAVLKIAQIAIDEGNFSERIFARCIRRFVDSSDLDPALEIYNNLRPLMPGHSPTVLSQEVNLAILAQNHPNPKFKEISSWLLKEISKNQTSFDNMRMRPKERCIYALIQGNQTSEAKTLIRAISKKVSDKTPGEPTLKLFNEIIKWFGRAKDLEGVFVTIDAIKRIGLEPNHETLEFLANAAATNMRTLPKPTAPEVVFIGRSNVGKSSLVNMLLNRKSLAPMSSMPGRTRTFNFYILNRDQPDLSSFYIVDVPGYGYAEATEKEKERWRYTLTSYIQNRDSLKVIFHLIDSRHGPVGEDQALMQAAYECRERVQYVVVLTKSDASGRVRDGKAKNSLISRTASALEKCGWSAGEVPVLLTSSRTKQGRTEMWRYLQGVMENNDQFDEEGKKTHSDWYLDWEEGKRGKTAEDLDIDTKTDPKTQAQNKTL